jgi:ribosome-binding factor A
MAQQRRRRATSSSRGYDRADRLSELLREIVAETLEHIDDDRLQLITITAVDVDRELEHAKIYYTCLDGDDLADDVVEGFAEQRGRVRKAIGAQAKLRRVPHLTFLPDDVQRSAQRIEEILATMPRLPDEPAATPDAATVDHDDEGDDGDDAR